MKAKKAAALKAAMVEEAGESVDDDEEDEDQPELQKNLLQRMPPLNPLRKKPLLRKHPQLPVMWITIP